MSTIKNTSPKIRVHPSCYFVALLFILLGRFRPFVLAMALIFLHECGHFFCANYFHWKTSGIYLYPYGGLSALKEDINIPIKEEFWVLVWGPLSQCFFYVVLRMLLPLSWHETLRLCHYALLAFNLLPIYPLDGGKLIYLIFCSLFSYHKALSVTFLCSYGVVLILLCLFLWRDLSLIFLILVLLLFLKLCIESHKQKYYYERFLLERYLHVYPYRHLSTISSPKKMRRDYHHRFWLGQDVCSEQEMLRRYYQKEFSVQARSGSKNTQI